MMVRKKFKSYVRFCKRCEKQYRTEAKTSRICQKCAIPRPGGRKGGRK